MVNSGEQAAQMCYEVWYTQLGPFLLSYTGSDPPAAKDKQYMYQGSRRVVLQDRDDQR